MRSGPQIEALIAACPSGSALNFSPGTRGASGLLINQVRARDPWTFPCWFRGAAYGRRHHSHPGQGCGSMSEG